MELVPAIAIMALIKKLVDVARYGTHGDINGVVTQLTTWAAGAVVFFLVAQTHWANGIVLAGRPVSAMNFWELVFAGVSIASGASVVQDSLKAVDNHNTAAIPTLLPAGPRRPEPKQPDVG